MLYFTDQQVSVLLWRDINYAFIEYAQDYLKSCEYAAQVATIPIKVGALTKPRNIITN